MSSPSTEMACTGDTLLMSPLNEGGRGEQMFQLLRGAGEGGDGGEDTPLSEPSGG